MSDTSPDDVEATQLTRELTSSGDGVINAPDLSGHTLGDFRVLRKLGEGGMATVYLAEQMSLERRVAIKVMSTATDDPAAAERSLKRFRTEGMAAAALTHPNIVQVYTVGSTEGGPNGETRRELPYIAMEYVRGRNLSELVRRDGPMPLPRAVHVIRQAAKALAAAHAAGVVHRDVKPANILVSQDWDVKVADFGLSQVTREQFGESISNAGLTQTGTTVGTPRYMSPEQIQAQPVDARSDIYSLGVTLYHLLAGRPPFDAQSPLVLASQHLRDEPPSLQTHRADVPSDLATLVHQMLAKDPNERIATAEDVVRSLGAIATTLSEFSAESPVLSSATNVSLPTPKAVPVRQSTASMPAHETTPGPWRTWRWTALLAVIVGLAVAWGTQPTSPLKGAVAVDQLGSAREQYVSAMLSGEPAAFRAVETYWPTETRYVRLAQSQRLLSALGDSRRADEARRLIETLSRVVDDPQYPLIADVAEISLLTSAGKDRDARRKSTTKLEADVRTKLTPAWQAVWDSARPQ